MTIGKRKINYSDRHHVNILMVLSVVKKEPFHVQDFNNVDHKWFNVQ